MKSGSERLEIHGNTETFNIEKSLLYKLQSNSYFKSLYKLKTYHEVVDEIYNEVGYIEPWAALHQVREPSPAYSLLYKLFLMRLTVKQINGLLSHADSPYIRAMGVLYLRYVCPPFRLYEFLEPLLDDKEEIYVRANDAVPAKFGEWVRGILLRPQFADTFLPRIPTMIQRGIEARLSERGGRGEKIAAPPRIRRDDGGQARSRSPHMRGENRDGMSRGDANARKRRRSRTHSRSRSPHSRPRHGDSGNRKSREHDRDHSRDHIRNRARSGDREGHSGSGGSAAWRTERGGEHYRRSADDRGRREGAPRRESYGDGRRGGKRDSRHVSSGEADRYRKQA